MRNRNLGPVAIVCVAAILLGASTYVSIEPGGPSYAARIGLFDQCLAIRNHEMQPGLEAGGVLDCPEDFNL